MPTIPQPLQQDFMGEFAMKNKLLGDIGETIRGGVEAGQKLSQIMEDKEFVNKALASVKTSFPDIKDNLSLPRDTTPQEAVVLIKNFGLAKERMDVYYWANYIQSKNNHEQASYRSSNHIKRGNKT